MAHNITLALQGIIDPTLAGYEERINYAADYFKALVDGFEIGFFCHQIDHIQKKLMQKRVLRQLAKFSHNTLHIAAFPGKPVENACLDKHIELCNFLYQNQLICAASFHLDMASCFQYIHSGTAKGMPLLWENMGKGASFGNTFDEALNAARTFPEWQMVLDVAHAMEMETASQPEIPRYITALEPIIRQVHFSWPGNLYTEKMVGKDFKTAHSLGHLARNGGTGKWEALRQLSPERVTIEGVVPVEPHGHKMVSREVEFIRRLLKK